MRTAGSTERPNFWIKGIEEEEHHAKSREITFNKIIEENPNPGETDTLAHPLSINVCWFHYLLM